MLNSIQVLDGVMDIEQNKFWGVTTGYFVADLVVKVRNNVDKMNLKAEIYKILARKFHSICIQLDDDE